MARKGRKAKGRSGSGGGLVSLIKSIVSSYVKDQRAYDKATAQQTARQAARSSMPRTASEAFYQRGIAASVRDVFNAQGTSVEPPNRPPMPQPPGMTGRINPMGRLTVPGASEPENRPPAQTSEP